MPATLSKSQYAIPTYLVGPDGEIINLAGLLQQLISAGGGAATSGVRDTAGNEVPVWKARTFAYDTSGNLSTETISDGGSQWVRTYSYAQGAQTTDSGWVKQ